MSSPADLADPIEVLADRYLLLEVLGAGGSATVYRSFDRHLKVFRAIKLVDPGLPRGPRLRHRLDQEAQLMARLQHPNVVTLYELGEDGDRWFLVMELVAGGSIGERLESHGPLPPQMAVGVAQGLLAALEFAHGHGIIHRDVKPHNILLDLDGTPRVTDFGIAREGDGALTRTGALLGTLAYMPPEQKASARSVDARSDLYAAGATLYAMLTGREPHDLFAAGLDPRVARERLGQLHPGLAQWIVRATHFHVDHRFESARAMASALHEVARALPPDPPSPPLVAPSKTAQARKLGTVGPTLMGATRSSEPTQLDHTPSGAPARLPGRAALLSDVRRRLLLAAAGGFVAALGVGLLSTLWLGLPWEEPAPIEEQMAVLAPVQPSPPPTELPEEALPALEVGPLPPSPLPPPSPPPVRPRSAGGLALDRREALAPEPVPQEGPPQPQDSAPVPSPEPQVAVRKRWKVLPLPDGKTPGVMATLEADSDVVDANGVTGRPALVLRCSKGGLQGLLYTGVEHLELSPLDPAAPFVSVEVSIGEDRQRKTFVVSSTESSLLEFRSDRKLIGRLLGAPEARFRYRSFLGSEVTAAFRPADRDLLFDLERLCP